MFSHIIYTERRFYAAFFCFSFWAFLNFATGFLVSNFTSLGRFGSP